MGSAWIQDIKKEWFLMGMLGAIALAAILPSLGQSGGLLHLDTITGLGIALIFFLHGVGLSPKAIKQGISNRRLHIFVQSATFIVYPLLWLLLGPAFQAIMPSASASASALAFGFCYLFVLPSTISSSVAMTSVAKGNVPAAIFNASLSSLLGVLITPFLIQIFMGMEGITLDIFDTALSISKLLLLPMIVGQLCRPIALKTLEKRKAIINKIDHSVADGIWHDLVADYVLSPDSNILLRNTGKSLCKRSRVGHQK